MSTKSFLSIIVVSETDLPFYIMGIGNSLTVKVDVLEVYVPLCEFLQLFNLRNSTDHELALIINFYCTSFIVTFGI